MKFVPHKYQTSAINTIVENSAIALFADPGLGKTVMALTAIAKLKKRTLIVAPLEVVYRVWPNEILKWDHTRHIKFTILHGPEKTQNLMSNSGIFVINPEGLKWLLKACTMRRYWPFKILIVDESTAFKNPSAKCFELLASVAPNFEKWMIMSGTPITKTYLDLWSQYYLIDSGKRLYDNFHKYRNKWFYRPEYQGFAWSLFPYAESEIKSKVFDCTIRISGADHLDLPEIVENDIEVTMPKRGADAYREMAQKMIVQIKEGEVITAANAAVKTGKLTCIADGFLYVNDIDPKTGKKVIVGVHDLHDAKIDALESLVNELNRSPLLVGYHYKHDLIKLKKRFPDASVFASGSTMEQKLATEREWNAGNIELLFAQIHATSMGLNLQKSDCYNIAFYSMPWAWIDYTQFIKRVARQGQKAKHIFVHRIMAKRTIDYLIADVLRQRDSQSRDFLGSFKKHLNDVLSL